MNWHERAIDVGITLVLTLVSSGVLLRLAKPALFDFIMYACGNRVERLKAIIEEAFAKEIVEREAMTAMVATHKDILEFIVESVKNQTRELPAMSLVLNRVADACERLSATVEKIDTSNGHLQVTIGKLEERIAGWEKIRDIDLLRMQESHESPKRFSDTIKP